MDRPAPGNWKLPLNGALQRPGRQSVMGTEVTQDHRAEAPSTGFRVRDEGARPGSGGLRPGGRRCAGCVGQECGGGLAAPAGPAQPRPKLPSRTTRRPLRTDRVLPLSPRGSSPSRVPHRFLKEKRKASATQSPSATRPLADVADRPKGASAQRRAFQLVGSNRRPSARRCPRGRLPSACARVGGPPRSHFRLWRECGSGSLPRLPAGRSRW